MIGFILANIVIVIGGCVGIYLDTTGNCKKPYVFYWLGFYTALIAMTIMNLR